MGLDRVRILSGKVGICDSIPTGQVRHDYSGLVDNGHIHLPFLCVPHDKEDNYHHGSKKDRNQEGGHEE